jgi:hypothetical protein
LLNSLRCFISQKNHDPQLNDQFRQLQWDDSDSDAVTSVFSNMMDRNAMIASGSYQPSGDEIYGLLSGWNGHMTGIAGSKVGSQNLILKCNKGVRDEKFEAGIHVYEIQQLNQLPSMLKSFADCKINPTKFDQVFFEHDSDQILGLTPIGVLKHKDQKIGNCPWASLELILRGAIYLRFRQKGLTHDEADANSRILYKLWNQYDEKIGVQESLKAIEDPTLDPDLAALEKKLLSLTMEKATHSHRDPNLLKLFTDHGFIPPPQPTS